MSIVVHLIFGGVATLLVVQRMQANRKLTFKGGPPSPNPATRSLEHKVQLAKKQNTMSAPTAVKRITTTGLSKVALPEMPEMPKLGSATSKMGAGGSGAAPGLGGATAMSGSGGGPGVNFFGLRVASKRIAFLLDYSGSMKGKFREVMEKELEKTLTHLPAGTQVLLIPWAGPAWLYNQTAPQIMKNWKMRDGYDNFELVPGVKLEPPAWVVIDRTTVERLMNGVRAQLAAPGGTDWRQPFLYAMQAKPPPEVIIFMTDGQIPGQTAKRAITAIDAALTSTGKPPQVNCLWIENSSYKSDLLKKLASSHGGQMQVVSEKSGSKE